MVAVAAPQSTPDQMEILFRRLLASAVAPTPVPAPAPEPPAVERLLQCLVAETKVRQPVLVAAPELAGLETLLRSLLSGQLAPAQQPRLGSFRRDWNAVVCFSCGKAGHSATRCPTLDDMLPFMLPGWKVEKTLGGYMMISPWAAAECLVRGGGGFHTRVSSKVRPQDPGGGGVQHGSPFPGKELLQGLEIYLCRPTWDHSRCLHGFR